MGFAKFFVHILRPKSAKLHTLTFNRSTLRAQQVTRGSVNARGREGAPKEHAWRILKLMDLASVTSQNQHHKKRGKIRAGRGT